MKRIIVLLLLLGFAYMACGQLVCGYEPEMQNRLTGSEYIANGGVFTPKGELRVLIVFISYGEPYDSQYLEGWPEDSDLPTWAHPDSPAVFHSDFSVFPTDIYSDTNRLSVSNFYYQMSNGTFKLIADYYPTRVRVDVSATDTWEDIHRKVLQQISDNINWSLYDNRTNHPGFIFDNSNSNPDNKIDYMVFCHRFSWDWNTLPSTNLSDQNANGVSVTKITTDFPTVGNGYQVNKDGFTFITGGERPLGIFVHEVGHELYNAPHYAGNNNVCGKYFYEPSAGWDTCLAHRPAAAAVHRHRSPVSP